MEKISPEQFKQMYGEDTYNQFGTPDNRQNIFERIVSDIPQDIKQVGSEIKSAISGGVQTAQTAREQVTTGEISPIAGTAKTIGGGLMAGAKAVGSLVSGLIKTPFTQDFETATGQKVQAGAEKVAETETVQNAINRYNELSPEQKAIVDGVLGTTAGLATIAGAKPVVDITTKAVTSPIPALKVGLEKIKDASNEVAQFGTGITGKTKAIDLGLKPEDLMQRVARVSKKKQSDFVDMSGGESVGQYLVNRNIFGTPDEIVDQLYNRFKESRLRKTESLKTVSGEFKAPQVQTALQQLIERDAKISTPNALHPDSKRIEELYKKNNQKGLTLSEVDEVKSIYERNIKLDYLRENVATGIEQANAIDSSLRKLVEDKASKSGIETVRQLNKETQLARQLMDDIGAEYAGQAGNNAIGLTDAIFLAEAIGSANPLAAAGFVAKKGLGSKTAMSFFAKKTAKAVGSKEALPEVPQQDKLTGYLKFLEDKTKKTNPNEIKNAEALGVFGGIETDENGDITINPYAALVGVGAVAMAKRVKDIKVPPDLVAKRMDEKDASILDDYISNPDSLNAYLKVQPLLKAIGVSDKTPESVKESYVKEVLTEYARLNQTVQ